MAASYKVLLIVTTLPIGMVLWWRRTLPESPRWLESQGDIESAEEMFAQTWTKAAPWTLVESEFKYYARLKVLKTVVKKFTQEFGE